MQSAHHSANTRSAVTEPQQFPDLLTGKRPYANTETTAYWVGRRPQTLLAWASLGKGPLHPVRIQGRLAWPVADIKRLLNVEGVKCPTSSLPPSP